MSTKTDRRRRKMHGDGEDEVLDENQQKRVSECESEGEVGEVGDLSEYESAVEEDGNVEHEESEGSETETDSGETQTGSETEGEDYQTVHGQERQSGDGEEQPEQPDDDEDKKNPAYVPRRGAFYEHDMREDEEGEAKPATEQEQPQQPYRKKLWQNSEKWSHDKFDNQSQAPKSREELMRIYGYDILSSDKPPDDPPARRGRGGGSPRDGRGQRRFHDFMPRGSTQDSADVGEIDAGSSGMRTRGRGGRGGRTTPRGRGSAGLLDGSSYRQRRSFNKEPDMNRDAMETEQTQRPNQVENLENKSNMDEYPSLQESRYTKVNRMNYDKERANTLPEHSQPGFESNNREPNRFDENQDQRRLDRFAENRDQKRPDHFSENRDQRRPDRFNENRNQRRRGTGRDRPNDFQGPRNTDRWRNIPERRNENFNRKNESVPGSQYERPPRGDKDNPTERDRGGYRGYDSQNRRPDRFNDRKFEDMSDGYRGYNNSRQDRFDNNSRQDRYENNGRQDRYENKSRQDRYENNGRQDRYENNSQQDRYENNSRQDRYENNSRQDRYENNSRQERFNNNNQRQDNSDRFGRPRRNKRGFEPPPRYQQQPNNTVESLESTNSTHQPTSNADNVSSQHSTSTTSTTSDSGPADRNVVLSNKENVQTINVTITSTTREKKSYAKERRAKAVGGPSRPEDELPTPTVSSLPSSGEGREPVTANQLDTSVAPPGHTKRYSSQRQQTLATKGGYSDTQAVTLYNPALPPPAFFTQDSPVSVPGNQITKPASPVVVQEQASYNPTMLPPNASLPYSLPASRPPVPLNTTNQQMYRQPQGAPTQPPPQHSQHPTTGIRASGAAGIIQPSFIAPGMIYGAPANVAPRVPPPGTPTGFSIPLAYTQPPPPPPPPVVSTQVPNSGPPPQPSVPTAGAQQPKKVYSGDIIYYAPELQQPSRQPVKRPKAAIPIINPQEIPKDRDVEKQLDMQMEALIYYDTQATELAQLQQGEGSEHTGYTIDTQGQVGENINYTHGVTTEYAGYIHKEDVDYTGIEQTENTTYDNDGNIGIIGSNPRETIAYIPREETLNTFSPPENEFQEASVAEQREIVTTEPFDKTPEVDKNDPGNDSLPQNEAETSELSSRDQQEDTGIFVSETSTDFGDETESSLPNQKSDIYFHETSEDIDKSISDTSKLSPENDIKVAKTDPIVEDLATKFQSGTLEENSRNCNEGGDSGFALNENSRVLDVAKSEISEENLMKSSGDMETISPAVFSEKISIKSDDQTVANQTIEQS